MELKQIKHCGDDWWGEGFLRKKSQLVITGFINQVTRLFCDYLIIPRARKIAVLKSFSQSLARPGIMASLSLLRIFK